MSSKEALEDTGMKPLRRWVLAQKTGVAVFELNEELVTTIGNEGCDIFIQSPTVEPEHAILWFDPDSSYFYLKDMDTSSGTFLNGKKMSSSISTKLRHMDLVRFGFDSNLYQIRYETAKEEVSSLSPKTRIEMDSQYHQTSKALDSPTHRNFSVPSTCTIQREDSGNGSSSSPSSPVKACLPSASEAVNSKEAQASTDTEHFPKKYSPLAFTVDFSGPESKNGFGISDSISKFAPTRAHRRNASLTNGGSTRSASGDRSSMNEVNLVKASKPASPTKIPTPSKRASLFSPKISSKTQQNDDEERSEAGTYTVELETQEIKDDEEIEETPLDSSLEWVREWAENASLHINKNPPIEQIEQHEPSHPSRQRMRSSWHEHYNEDEVFRSHHQTVKARLDNSLRMRREASAISDYSAYGCRAQSYRHAPTGSNNSSAILGKNEQEKRRINASRSVSPAPFQSPFERNDGGRFSLRNANNSKASTPTRVQGDSLHKSTPKPLKSNQSKAVATVAPNTKRIPLDNAKKEVSLNSNVKKSNKKSAIPPSKRCNSTLTAKEVELANWNRRKNYDPMKAAALGKKKEKKPSVETSSTNEEPGQRINPDGAASIPKSPSFQGRAYGLDSSTEDLASEEEIRPPMKQSLMRMGSMTMSLQRCVRNDVNYMRSPSPSPHPKHKFEALDCLVISTIHSLSSKVRTSSRLLLEKLQLQQDDDENGALMEEMISQLADLEMVASPQHKNPSRELSGTLKNLKKLEQVILVLDRVLCGETEEL